VERPLKILIVLAGLAVAGAAAFFLVTRDHGPGHVEMPAAVSGDVTSSGEAAIGGPFTLIDTHGNEVSDQDLLGRYALIYFGYSNCPDVCPLDMNRATLALEQLSQMTDWEGKLQPVFITVDPERDTPDALAKFLSSFHPSFLGLTGTPEHIAAVAKAYRVAIEVMTDEHHHATGMINHSAFFYLMGPDGKFIAAFDGDLPAPAFAEQLAARLN
jgi:protein SCO1